MERLLKALRQARPGTVRQFFALANQRMRWELNDLARRLDEQPGAVELQDGLIAGPDSSGSALSPGARRLLDGIDALLADEREVLSLARIQGMTHPEVADLLGVSTKTVQRRLNRGLVLLAEWVGDPRPTADGRE